LTIIRNFVGVDSIKTQENVVVEEIKRATTETLEQQLDRLRNIEKRSD